MEKIKQPVLCYCLDITEAEVEETVRAKGLTTVKEIARTIGAGGGCTACHRALKKCLDHHASTCSGQAVHSGNFQVQPL